jgi:hypothetical protein
MAELRFCGACGNERTSASDRFCRACGAALGVDDARITPTGASHGEVGATDETKPTVTTTRIAELLTSELRHLPGVSSSNVVVTLRSGDVLVKADIKSRADTREVRYSALGMISAVVEGQLRLKLAETPSLSINAVRASPDASRQTDAERIGFLNIKPVAAGASESRPSGNAPGKEMWREALSVIAGLILAFVVTGILGGGPIMIILLFLPATAIARLVFSRISLGETN